MHWKRELSKPRPTGFRTNEIIPVNYLHIGLISSLIVLFGTSPKRFFPSGKIKRFWVNRPLFILVVFFEIRKITERRRKASRNRKFNLQTFTCMVAIPFFFLFKWVYFEKLCREIYLLWSYCGYVTSDPRNSAPSVWIIGKLTKKSWQPNAKYLPLTHAHWTRRLKSWRQSRKWKE